jgi:hypothetical protein
MECPVCYERATLCTFTCGHALCDACTKKWYTKGSHPTCPMCRASICFRGILKKKRAWYQDRLEGVYTDLMTQVCDELFEDYSDILIDCLETVQNRYEYTVSKYPNISCDDLDFVIRLTWLDVDYILNTSGAKIYEPATYNRYIMVSNCTYGVINSKHPIHMCW